MLVVSLITLALSLVNKVALGQECGGDNPPFDVIHEAAQHYCQCNFPTAQFNVDCLLTSCPSLTGLCPLTSDKKVNQTALTSAVSVLNACISKNSLVCNYNMSRTTMADLSWTTAQLLPPEVVNGTIVHIPGSGYVENLSNSTFTVQGNENPITLTIEARNVTSEGFYNCQFHVAPTSILRSLRGLIPDISSLNIPNLTGVYYINVTSTVAINITAPTPTVETLQQQFDLNIYFSNFVNAKGDGLPQEWVDKYNEQMQSLIEESVVPSAIINLLSTYAAIGLQAAQLNCP